MLAPWKKIYEKPRQSIQKQRCHFADKGPYSQSCGFSSSHMQICELAIKKAKCWRIDAFKLLCWRRLNPLDCKEIKPINPKGNQPWIFIHWKDWCWSFGLLVWRANSLEKTLMLGKMGAGEEGDRGWDGWLTSPTQWRTGKSGMLQFTGSQRVRHDLVTKKQQILHDIGVMCLALYCWKLFVLIHILLLWIKLLWAFVYRLFSEHNVFFGINTQEFDCWLVWEGCVWFLKKLSSYFSGLAVALHSHQQCRRDPVFLHLH